MASTSVGAGPEIVNDADCADVVDGAVVDKRGSSVDDLFFDVLDEKQADWLLRTGRPPVSDAVNLFHLHNTAFRAPNLLLTGVPGPKSGCS